MSRQTLENVFEFLGYLGLDVQFAQPPGQLFYAPGGSNEPEFEGAANVFIRGTIYLNFNPRFFLFSKARGVHRFTAETVLHEVGHFLLATPKRRARVNYGIPEARATRGPRRRRAWDEDEVKANLIDRYLLTRFGFPKSRKVNFLLKRASDKKKIEAWWRREGLSLARGAVQAWLDSR